MILSLNLPKRSLLAICASATLIFVLTLSFACWQWHQDWVLAHQATTTLSKTPKTDQTAQMIATIPEQHLFGKSISKMGAVPITNLQFKVTGIAFVASDQNAEPSKAYISVSGQPSKIYQIGDALPYGVKLYAITSETVILDNDGHLEKLPLPREKLQFKPRDSEERA